MVKENPTEKRSRIASYKVPTGTWALCGLMVALSAGVHYSHDNTLHQIAELALFIVFIANALNFVIPFVWPNSVLGGAKFKLLVLASFALLGMLSV